MIMINININLHDFHCFSSFKQHNQPPPIRNKCDISSLVKRGSGWSLTIESTRVA